jgi:dienelactone hydrolase
LAGEADLCAVVAGEPASVLFTGMMKPGMSDRGPAFQDVMNNPRKYYTPELQTFTRAKIARIHCPVLFVLGDRHPIVKVNHEVVIPEMKAAHKPFEVIVYPGQPHSFYWGIIGDPAAGSKFFDDAQAFLKKYLPTQPRAIDESLIKRLPVPDRDPAQEAEDRPGKSKRAR